MSDSLPRGTEYELFVQEVYRRLYSAEGIEDAMIQHNVTMTGMSGTTHQIDLYWEFTLAGIRHRIAVECKDYSSPVKKSKIAAFKAVLDDIGGNIQGIYACRSGYQSGALKFAESYGIQPMIIRAPIDKDWEGYIKDIFVDIRVQMIENVRVHVEADGKWLREHMIDIREDKQAMLQIEGLDSEIFIEDLDRDETRSIYEYKNSVSRDRIGKDQEVEFEYKDAYLISKSGRYKINKFRIQYDVSELIDRLHIKGDQVIEAIVRNSLANREQLIGFDGSVRERS